MKKCFHFLYSGHSQGRRVLDPFSRAEYLIILLRAANNKCYFSTSLGSVSAFVPGQCLSARGAFEVPAPAPAGFLSFTFELTHLASHCWWEASWGCSEASLSFLHSGLGPHQCRLISATRSYTGGSGGRVIRPNMINISFYRMPSEAYTRRRRDFKWQNNYLQHPRRWLSTAYRPGAATKLREMAGSSCFPRRFLDREW